MCKPSPETAASDERALLAHAPPNGGLAAWLRVAAYGVMGMATLGVHYLFGARYVVLLEDLPEPFPGALALTGSLCIAVFTNSAPLAAALSSRWGARPTALLGSLICGGGLALSASASSAWVLYGTFAIVGVGQALAFFSAVLLMMAWFDSRLNRVHALANSLAAGTTLFLGPPAHGILEAIGWRRALLALGLAATLMLGSASLLLTPPAGGRGGVGEGDASRVSYASCAGSRRASVSTGWAAGSPWCTSCASGASAG